MDYQLISDKNKKDRKSVQHQGREIGVITKYRKHGTTLFFTVVEHKNGSVLGGNFSSMNDALGYIFMINKMATPDEWALHLKEKKNEKTNPRQSA